MDDFHLAIDKSGKDWDRVKPETSSVPWSLGLHGLSHGLRSLTLDKGVQPGLDVFGKCLEDWPFLEIWHMEYDQCIVDTLEPPSEAELKRMAQYAPDTLGSAHDRFWRAAAAAPQRMPVLKLVRLWSGSSTGPQFMLTTGPPTFTSRPFFRIEWLDCVNDAHVWTPSRRVLSAWRDAAASKHYKAPNIMMVKAYYMELNVMVVKVRAMGPSGSPGENAADVTDALYGVFPTTAAESPLVLKKQVPVPASFKVDAGYLNGCSRGPPVPEAAMGGLGLH